MKRKMVLDPSWSSLLGTIEFISYNILRVYLVSFLYTIIYPKIIVKPFLAIMDGL